MRKAARGPLRFAALKRWRASHAGGNTRTCPTCHLDKYNAVEKIHACPLDDQGNVRALYPNRALLLTRALTAAASLQAVACAAKSYAACPFFATGGAKNTTNCKKWHHEIFEAESAAAKSSGGGGKAGAKGSGAGVYGSKTLTVFSVRALAAPSMRCPG